MTTTQLATSLDKTPMSTMRQQENQQNMGGHMLLNPYIKSSDACEWGCGRSAPVDGGWGRIHGANCLAHPFKTKGSWEFLWRTLSCNVPVDCFHIILALGNLNSPVPRSGSAMLIQRIFRGWAVRRPIPSLVVLSANHAMHLANEDIMKFTLLHVGLIRIMGINKQKQDKGSSVKPPLLVHA